MIRPRGGNFVYSDDELNTMEDEINQCKIMGITEIVFGVLTKDNTIDFDVTQTLAKRAVPMKVTFHKAIDEAPNILSELRKLKSIPEISSILTSGGQATAKEGAEVLKEMIQISGNDIVIIPAGKITDENIKEIHELIGANEYHGRKIVGELP